jgi:hypothetical protein
VSSQTRQPERTHLDFYGQDYEYVYSKQIAHSAARRQDLREIVRWAIAYSVRDEESARKRTCVDQKPRYALMPQQKEAGESSGVWVLLAPPAPDLGIGRGIGLLSVA